MKPVIATVALTGTAMFGTVGCGDNWPCTEVYDSRLEVSTENSLRLAGYNTCQTPNSSEEPWTSGNRMVTIYMSLDSGEVKRVVSHDPAKSGDTAVWTAPSGVKFSDAQMDRLLAATQKFWKAEVKFLEESVKGLPEFSGWKGQVTPAKPK